MASVRLPGQSRWLGQGLTVTGLRIFTLWPFPVTWQTCFSGTEVLLRVTEGTSAAPSDWNNPPSRRLVPTGQYSLSHPRGTHRAFLAGWALGAAVQRNGATCCECIEALPPLSLGHPQFPDSPKPPGPGATPPSLQGQGHWEQARHRTTSLIHVGECGWRSLWPSDPSQGLQGGGHAHQAHWPG